MHVGFNSRRERRRRGRRKKGKKEKRGRKILWEDSVVLVNVSLPFCLAVFKSVEIRLVDWFSLLFCCTIFTGSIEA